MGITAIRRDYGVTPSMVRIETTDTLATVSTTGYITSQASEINQLNKGAFQWEVSDAVLVYAVNGVELYEISSDFASLIPISSGATGPYLEKALNLSDVSNVLESFNNLGLGSGETEVIADGDFLASVYELPVPCPNFVIATSSSPGLQIKLPVANIAESFTISQGPTIQALSTSGDSIEVIDQNDNPLFTLQPNDRVFFSLRDNSTAAGDWGIYPQTVTVNDRSGIVTVDQQNAYDFSATGNIDLDTDKHITYTATDAGFALPSMTAAQFDAIPNPPNALMAWASDSDRIRVQKSAPGAPVYDEVAYLTDIAAGVNDAVYGETHFQGNAVETVIAGVGVPLLIAGGYAAGDLLGFTELNGVLTYTDAPTRGVQIDASITATMNLSTADLTFTVFQNGVAVAKSAMSPSVDGVTPSPKSVSLNCLLQVNTGDTIALYVQNNTNTDNVLVQDLNLKVTAIGGVGGSGAGLDLEDAYTNGDGTMIMTTGKPLEFQSNDLLIDSNFNYRLTQIPAVDQIIGVEGAWSKDTGGTDRLYSNMQHLVKDPTAGSYAGGFSIGARRNYPVGAQGFNDVITYDGTTDILNFYNRASVGPTSRGVASTLFVVSNPKVSSVSAEELIWDDIRGQNVVEALSLDVGDVIEIDCYGRIQVQIADTAVITPSYWRVTFGGIIDVQTNYVNTTGFPLNFDGWFNWKLKIIRSNVNAGAQLNVSGSGIFTDTTGNFRPITWPNQVWTSGYVSGASYPINIYFNQGVATGTPGDLYQYPAFGCTVNQYSAGDNQPPF